MGNDPTSFLDPSSSDFGLGINGQPLDSGGGGNTSGLTSSGSGFNWNSFLGNALTAGGNLGSAALKGNTQAQKKSSGVSTLVIIAVVGVIAVLGLFLVLGRR